MAQYDFVLFDADNTLFDFDAAERAALQAVFGRLGYPFNAETEALYHGINRALWSAYERGEAAQEWLMAERFRRLFVQLGGGGDPEEVNAVFLRELAEGAALLPGALELVQALAGQCTLAIVTNGVTEVQRRRFAQSPVTPYCKEIFISEHLGCRKPEPRFFDLVCERLGIADRARAVVIGDSPEADIKGGTAAGIDTIWFNPHGRRCEVVPTWEVRSLTEIPNILLREKAGDNPD